MNARLLVVANLVAAGTAWADEKLAKTTIETNPAGATVQVDGAEQATRTPTTVSLARGRHVVTVTSPDRQTERRAVDAAGAPLRVSIDMIKVPPDGAKQLDAAAGKALVDVLATATRSAKLRDVSVALRGGDVTVTLANVGFDAAALALASDAATAIREVANLLKAQAGVRFVVVGHTDNTPFKSDLARDNTELSLAHAVAVARVLIGAGIPEADVSADGRGDLDPIASNGTADGKRKNRRIEIILVPKPAEAAASEKPKAKTLTAEAFKQRMSTLKDRAQACYKGNPANVMVKLTVAPSGQVTKTVVSPPFAGKPEGDCITNIVKDITFDAWDGGAQTYSFAFLLSA